MAARRAGSAYASALAISSVRLVSSVSMTLSPCLRSELPVSVTSTIASTMSGTLASVAPYDGTMRARDADLFEDSAGSARGTPSTP